MSLYSPLRRHLLGDHATPSNEAVAGFYSIRRKRSLNRSKPGTTRSGTGHGARTCLPTHPTQCRRVAIASAPMRAALSLGDVHTEYRGILAISPAFQPAAVSPNSTRSRHCWRSVGASTNAWLRARTRLAPLGLVIDRLEQPPPVHGLQHRRRRRRLGWICDVSPISCDAPTSPIHRELRHGWLGHIHDRRRPRAPRRESPGSYGGDGGV